MLNKLIIFQRTYALEPDECPPSRLVQADKVLLFWGYLENDSIKEPERNEFMLSDINNAIKQPNDYSCYVNLQ